MENESKSIKIVAQMTGFKNLSNGGWRLSVDLFESRLEDILSVAALVNSSSNVKVEISPVEE